MASVNHDMDPVSELDPAYDTSPHKAALLRAGVDERAIASLPQGSVVARGGTLLSAERALGGAVDELRRAVDNMVDHGLPIAASTERISRLTGYLAGLRQGIELVTGSANDRAGKE